MLQKLFLQLATKADQKRKQPFGPAAERRFIQLGLGVLDMTGFKVFIWVALGRNC